MGKSYINLKKIRVADGEAEFEAELSNQALEKNSAKILAQLSENFEMPGFRKGKVSEEVVKKHINEMQLLADAANGAIGDAIREIVADEKVAMISSPEAEIMKLAPNNPVIFRARFILMPVITLPDYKKIAIKISKREDVAEVTDKELDEAIERIKKMLPPVKDENGADRAPALTDELVKQLGGFNNVEEFKNELKKQLLEENKMKLKYAKRDEIAREIVKDSKIKIPQRLLDLEAKNFATRRDDELKRSGLSMEGYLKEIKKNSEELEKEERKYIEDQMKTQFVMMEVQKKEGIEASEKEIHENIEALKMRYPNKDHEYLHRMAEDIIVNTKLFAILEGVKEDSKGE